MIVIVEKRNCVAKEFGVVGARFEEPCVAALKGQFERAFIELAQT
jgi:hypothetical protein